MIAGQEGGNPSKDKCRVILSGWGTSKELAVCLSRINQQGAEEYDTKKLLDRFINGIGGWVGVLLRQQKFTVCRILATLHVSTRRSHESYGSDIRYNDT